MLTDSGERLPLPLPTAGGAFDYSIDRSGWVALQVEYQVFGLRDGDLLRPSRLPDAWTLAPAADPSLVLVQRYFEDDRAKVIELVDMHGRVLRSVTSNLWWAVGELRSGWIATAESMLSWEGERRPLPAPGQAVAVLSGRHLVIADDDRSSVHIVDMETERTTTWPVPPDANWLAPMYDTEASQVAFADPRAPGVSIVVREHEVHLLDTETEMMWLAWVDRDHVLETGQGPSRSVNFVTKATELLSGFPARSFPRINITGRFDPDQLRNALLPAWKGPIPEDVRERLVLQTQNALVAALHSAGLPADELIRRFVPAVRLRSCFSTGRVPVGASHFGGRPDLPAGHQWPTYDGQPMMFIAQIRADEINAVLPGALPSNDALVAVFAAIEPDGGYPVAPDAVSVLVVPVAGLSRLPWPTRLPAELRLTMAIAVPEPMLTPPPNTHDIDSDKLRDVVASLMPAGSRHQMFGSPQTVQNDGAPPDHRLLLQFDSDPLVGGPELGDGGCLVVWSANLGEASNLESCIVELDSY